MIRTNIPVPKKLWIPLMISLLFFMRKGLQYIVIGSYVPMLLIAIIILLMVLSLQKNSIKSFRMIVKIWGILLIIWATVRILLTVINFSMKPLSEYHINYQLGVGGSILSCIGLWIGIHLLINIKKKKFNL